MTSYTITLQSEDDFRILKKILKAFEGATISPVTKKSGSLDAALKEVEDGEIVGPFDSVNSLMNDLLG